MNKKEGVIKEIEYNQQYTIIIFHLIRSTFFSLVFQDIDMTLIRIIYR